MLIQNVIKNLFKKEISIEEQEHMDFVQNTLPTLKFGDIIYAERFNNDIEKEEMGEGHETGPFIVIGFDKDRIIGCCLTSQEYGIHNFEVGEDYELFNRGKRTYATLDCNLKTIDDIAFFNKSGKNISKFDRKKLIKKLTLNGDIYYNDFANYKKYELDIDLNNDIKFEVGDTVLYSDNVYLIIDINKYRDYTLVPISNYNVHHSYIDFSKVKTDYKNAVYTNTKKLTYLNTIPNVQLKIILNGYSNYLKNDEKNKVKTNNNIICRGCLVEKYNKFRYVYGITGEVANTFMVSKNENTDEGFITINGDKYIPSFDNELDININKDYCKVLSIADDDEIDNISTQKKTYNKHHKDNQNGNTKSKGLDIGDIVNPKNDIYKRYMIVNKFGRELTVISLTDLINKEKLEYSSILSTQVKRCKNITSIELDIIKTKLQKLAYDQNIDYLLKNKLK